MKDGATGHRIKESESAVLEAEYALRKNLEGRKNVLTFIGAHGRRGQGNQRITRIKCHNDAFMAFMLQKKSINNTDMGHKLPSWARHGLKCWKIGSETKAGTAPASSPMQSANRRG